MIVFFEVNFFGASIRTIVILLELELIIFNKNLKNMREMSFYADEEKKKHSGTVIGIDLGCLPRIETSKSKRSPLLLFYLSRWKL